jgi:hypothetical protein
MHGVCSRRTYQAMMAKLESFYHSTHFCWMILALGIGARLHEYLFNRSFRGDEGYIVLNIISRSFSELLEPLDYNQMAPIGFLFIERLAFEIFGDNEFVFRFFPFISGVLSLPLFYGVSRSLLPRQAIPLALGIFAISSHLIFFSSDVKQYSSDVVITLFLFIMAVKAEMGKRGWSYSILFGVLGAVSIWFSHPAVFTLVGIAITLIVFQSGQMKLDISKTLLIMILFWLFSFIVFYIGFAHESTMNSSLVEFWKSGFAPFPPVSVSDIKWYLNTFFNIFENPVGLYLKGIAALAFVIGLLALFRTNQESCFLSISPMIMAFIASCLQKYPFRGRFLLFITPLLIIFISNGLIKILNATKNSFQIIGIFTIILIFLHPILSLALQLFYYQPEYDIKPILNFLSKNIQNDDIIYVSYNREHLFRYYAKFYGFNDWQYIVGSRWTKEPRKYLDELNNLPDKRVWILFPLNYKDDNIDEEKYFLYHLDCIGKQLSSFRYHGSSLYLYDLSEEPEINRCGVKS